MPRVGTIVVIKPPINKEGLPVHSGVRFLTTIPPATMVQHLRFMEGRGIVLAGQIGAAFTHQITLITGKHIEDTTIIRCAVQGVLIIECDDSLVLFSENILDGCTLEARLGDQIE